MLRDSAVSAILPVTDIERAKEFYGRTLGLPELGTFGDVVMYGGGAGTSFVIYQRDEPTQAKHTVMGFNVSSLEEEMKELRGRSVIFEEYDMPNLKTVNGVVDYGHVKSAWFKDPDGNIIALNQM